MKRERIVSIRFTQTEWEMLKEKAHKARGSPGRKDRENFSGYLREKVMAESSGRNLMLEKKLEAVAYELRKIGVNVNQIAKKANSGFGTVNDLYELRKNQERIRQSLEEVKKEVGKWRSQN